LRPLHPSRLLVARPDRLAEALTIAHGARRIAMQTVCGGMALSGAAMAAAALGFLPPAAGALLQEVIDVAAILNSLRVLRVSIPGRSKITLPATEIAQLKAEHEDLSRLLDRLRALADRLAALSPAEAAVALTEADTLVRRLLRHEREDDTRLYPLIERMLGGSDPIASMHRAHREVQQLGGLLGRMVTDLPPGGPAEESMNNFRRLLYALDAILICTSRRRPRCTTDWRMRNTHGLIRGWRVPNGQQSVNNASMNRATPGPLADEPSRILLQRPNV
jgi:iron-sulfur cluster repair protein YtfE (RIC family)